MSTSNNSGLEKLSQILCKALELRNCSFCLKNLDKTVLLWPCLHRFCNNCMSVSLKSSPGEILLCPLCKGEITSKKRSSLLFEDKQKEYETNLIKLIEAINFDLGFDITTYKDLNKNEELAAESKKIKTNLIRKTPIRKTRHRSSVKVFERKCKIDLLPKGIRRVTRRSTDVETPKPTHKNDLESLPETSKDSNHSEKKVKEWLESTKFTHDVHSFSETGVNKAESESLASTEDQLQSVTQVDSKSIQSPFKGKSYNNKCKTRLKKEIDSGVVEKFDLLSSKNNKSQHKTYDTKKTFSTSKKRWKSFKNKSDLFKSNEELDDQFTKFQTNEKSQSTENDLEDFSSGSGEEWVVNKKKKNIINKKNRIFKSSNKISQSKYKKNINQNCLNPTATRSSLRICKNKDTEKSEVNITNGNESNLKSMKPEQNLRRSYEVIKEITDEWNETGNPPQIKDHTVNCGAVDIHKTPVVDSTPVKQITRRSPGWSRLKSTKKEFHMTEKNKLTLKTHNKSELHHKSINNDLIPLCKNNNSIIKSGKEIDQGKPIDHQSECGRIVASSKQAMTLDGSPKKSLSVKQKKALAEFKSDNISFIYTASNSVSKGFEVPQKNKELLQKLILDTDQGQVEPNMPVDRIISQENINQYKMNNTILNECIKNDIIVDTELHKFDVPEEVDGNICMEKTNLSTYKSKSEIESIENSHIQDDSKLQKDKDQSMHENDDVYKKRDRDCDFLKESVYHSPKRKKVCRDVEVQTSPENIHSLVKDVLKSSWGIDLEQMIKHTEFGNCNIKIPSLDETALLPTQLNSANESMVVNGTLKTSNSQKDCANKFSQEYCIQNVDVIKKIPNTAETCLNELDFVVGTEEHNQPHLKQSVSVGSQEKKHTYLQTAKTNSCTLNKESELIDSDEFEKVKCDGVTQPYKTPIGSKEGHKTHTSNLYSFVSNPTQSELKNANDNFLKDDLICLGDTKHVLTPANYSGINPLEDSYVKSSNDTDIAVRPILYQTKTNKSRRQLDFANEDSTSNDMFYGHMGENSETTREHTLKDFNLIPGVCNNDYFIEGTPDVMQTDTQEKEQPLLEEDINALDTTELQNNGDKRVVTAKKYFNKDDNNMVSESSETNMSKESNNIEPGKKQEVPLLYRVNSDSPVKISNESIEELKELKEEHCCFSSSLLSVQQNHVLGYVLNGLNISYSKTMGKHVSHLIVGTSDGRTQNSYKVLYAMALHKPIIRFEWVEDVLKEGALVPLDMYLALDPSGECGVLRAKEDKNRELLKDFAIHIYNVIDKVIQKSQIEELIRLCGGTIVSELQNFHSVPRNMFRIIIISKHPDTLTEAEWQQMYVKWRQIFAAVEVSVDWIYNTIGRYRVVPLGPFMDNPTDALSFLRDKCYPEDLIFDSPSQEESLSC